MTWLWWQTATPLSHFSSSNGCQNYKDNCKKGADLVMTKYPLHSKEKSLLHCAQLFSQFLQWLIWCYSIKAFISDLRNKTASRTASFLSSVPPTGVFKQTEMCAERNNTRRLHGLYGLLTMGKQGDHRKESRSLRKEQCPPKLTPTWAMLGTKVLSRLQESFRFLKKREGNQVWRVEALPPPPTSAFSLGVGGKCSRKKRKVLCAAGYLGS